MEPAGSQRTLIKSVEPDSSELEQVKALWRRHSANLGFFAEGAFVERAQKKQILGAIIGENVIGYVTFFRNRRDEIRITHLCVDDSHQRRGIARELVQALIAGVRNAARVRPWCRRDFTTACKAWVRPLR
jgi:ribosomal protein S18 acetylase RimI-like enzyme